MMKLKAIKICFIAAAMLGLYALWGNDYSTDSESYKQSEAILNQLLADSLKKDPNEFTLEDILKLKRMVAIGEDVTTINPLLKYKNMESLSIFGYDYIDLNPLSKLKKLNSLEIDFGKRIHYKSKWYDKLFSILRISRPYNSIPEPFDLGRLKKLDNLEKLVLERYDSIDNIEALASLKNLEYLTLQPNRNKITAVLVINGVPQKPLADYANEPLDLSPIGNLTKLTRLSLSGVKAKDFNFILNLTNLKYLFLGGRDVSNEQIKELQKALPELEIVK